MSRRTSIIWFTFAGLAGIIFGVFYSVFGLEGLPVYQRIVPSEHLDSWSNGLYGSTFIGFSVLLLLIGRYAFQKSDKQLMKVLLYGISAWLIVEAFYSLIYGVYLNIGVDIALMAFLGYPLLRGIKSAK